MSGAQPVWRRVLAVVALLGCAGLAWQTAQGRPRELSVTWLLTHVEAAGGAAGRDRLVAVSWRVPQAAGAAQTAASGSVRFDTGRAPEASGPHLLRVPSGVAEADVRCEFALAAGAVVQTRGKVALPGDGEQATVDLGTCGPGGQ